MMLVCKKMYLAVLAVVAMAASSLAFMAPMSMYPGMRTAHFGGLRLRAANIHPRPGTGRIKLAPRMQWKDAEELYQQKWDAFAAYNMGRWKGRALHISPDTGEYIPPYAKEHVVDVMQFVEGAQSAKMRTMTGNETAPRMTESVITVNEDFECSEDGSYSRDTTFSEIPDVDGTSRFCIEVSLQLTGQERVRFQALYDFESRLTRIVVCEEYRVSSTGSQRLIGIKLDDSFTNHITASGTIRSPLTMLSLIGEFRGESKGRRAARLGGGVLDSASRSGLQWDGKTLRKELELVDERLRTARKVNFGEMDGTVQEVVTLDDGYRLLLLPSGCWCCLPYRLESESASSSFTSSSSASSESSDAPAPQASAQASSQSDQAKLEAMLRGSAPSEKIVRLRPFTAEFGCFLSESKRKRIVRLYNTDGSCLTTTMAVEERADDKLKEGGARKGAMYDEFAE